MSTLDIKKLTQALQRDKRVSFAYLFGSALDGKLPRQDADIDIGVYIEGKINYDVVIDIMGLCQEALGYEKVDIALLNRANPILRFEVISGRPLVIKDKELHATFFSLTCREYEDEMMRLRKAKEY
jgi:predicted nucleotidyltransferase